MASPDATFFHRAGWKTVLERAFGHRTHFLYAERNGQIEGILPLAQVKSLLFGNNLSSLPFLRLRRHCRDHPGSGSGAPACRLRPRHAPAGRRPRVPQAARHQFRLARQEPLRHLPQAHRPGPRGEPQGHPGPPARDGAQGHRRRPRGRVRRRLRPHLPRVLGKRAQSRHPGVLQKVPPRAARGVRQGLRRADDYPERARRGRRDELLLPRPGAAVLRRQHRRGPRDPRLQPLHVLGPDAPLGRARLPAVRFRTQQGRHRSVYLQEELRLHARAAALRVLFW